MRSAGIEGRGHVRPGDRGGRTASLEAEGFAHMKPRASDSLAAKVRQGFVAPVSGKLAACCASKRQIDTPARLPACLEPSLMQIAVYEFSLHSGALAFKVETLNPWGR